MALIELKFSSSALAQSAKDQRRDQLIASIKTRMDSPMSDAELTAKLTEVFNYVVRLVDDHPSTRICDPFSRQLYWDDVLSRLVSFHDPQQISLAWVYPPGISIYPLAVVRHADAVTVEDDVAVGG